MAIGISFFAAAFSVGMGPATYVYMSEVFDNSLRAKGVGASFFFSRMVQALWLFAFPLMQPRIGLTGVFAILSFANVLCLAFYWLCCPETKGFSLENIQSEVFGQKV